MRKLDQIVVQIGYGMSNKARWNCQIVLGSGDSALAANLWKWLLMATNGMK